MTTEVQYALRKIADPRTRQLVYQAATTPLDPDCLNRENAELIERLAEPLDFLMRLYFRFEIRGIDTVPTGPALVVMNHESGISDIEIIGLGARWYRRRGVQEQLVGLMHDAMFEVPYLGNLLSALGAVRASPENAAEALKRGLKVVVAPGGNMEAFRPWHERYQIKFAGHKGWARLALRLGVPVIPLVFAGGHESFFVLRDGQSLVQRLGLKRVARIDTFPLFLGLPWGIGLGPLFHIPLPTKITARFLPAFLPDTYSEASTPAEEVPPSEDAVEDLYTDVTERMQKALSEMASERRLPILG